MGKRIVVVGGGAIGSYIAARMIRGGEDVTVVDPWPENVEVMRNEGIHIKGVTSQEELKEIRMNTNLLIKVTMPFIILGFLAFPVIVAFFAWQRGLGSTH